MKRPGIGGLLKSLLSVPRDFLGGIREVRGGMSEIKRFKDAKAMLFYDGRCRLVNADLSDDLGWIVPKSYNLRFRNAKSYILEPDNLPIFFCHIDNPQAIDWDKPPKMDECDKDVEYLEEVKGKTIKVYDVDKFKLYGGRIISEISHLLGTTAILQLLEPPSKREILYMCGLTGLFCFILGLFAYGVFLS